LELVSYSWHIESGLAILEGQVTNISSQPLRRVQVVASFYDADGGFITSETTHIEYDPVLPGQTSPFRAYQTQNPAMNKAAVAFKHSSGDSIPFRAVPFPSPVKEAHKPDAPERNGQTTWQGLQFGMNRQQARDVLSANGFSLREGRDSGSNIVDPDFELKTNSPILSSNYNPDVASASMFFKPELVFGTQGGLQTVKLDLDQARVAQSAPAFRSNAGTVLLTVVAGTSVYEQLTGEYGQPVGARGPCNNTSASRLVGSIQECSAKWKDSGQTIELFWSYNWPLQKLSFFITYSGTASGL
jgi:hypothetical protein